MKEKMLDKISSKCLQYFNQALAWKHGSDIAPPEVLDLTLKYYDKVFNMRVWPYDFGILIKVSLLAATPIISIVTQYIIHHLLALI
ncbi:MAG: hypothetical protein AOA65_0509 [Candidatus Bathyarchaeota archaeon BA1]|nr:MAG: hypothetical protein AOA65_0509 [Candidatus Bathyarchaeota archaeon BA1]